MWTEEKLDTLLTTPSDALIRDMACWKGDIMLLGAGGKMGPSLAVLALNALRAAGRKDRVIAVSRFSDAGAAEWLKKSGVTDPLDLMAQDALPGPSELRERCFKGGSNLHAGQSAYMGH
jgi:hypothetical protein